MPQCPLLPQKLPVHWLAALQLAPLASAQVPVVTLQRPDVQLLAAFPAVHEPEPAGAVATVCVTTDEVFAWRSVSPL